MRYLRFCSLPVVVVLALTVALPRPAAAASGLFDWLSSRCSGQPAEVTAYYPVTTQYVTSSVDCCAPTICCDVPAPAYCPPMVVQEARPTFWQRLCAGCSSGGVQRQTLFRTNWTKIPVTSYRPTVTMDPVTGCPVTVMQPCTTHTWQADRQRCGLFDRLLGRCDTQPPVATVCPPSVTYSGMSGVVTSDCCGPATFSSESSMATPVPTPAPYYAPGSPTPATVTPGGMAPTSPPTLSPQFPPPPAGGSVLPPSASPTPADTRPSLKPADVNPESEGGNVPNMSVLPSFGAPSAAGDPTMPLPTFGPPQLNGTHPRVNPVPGPNASPVVPAEEPAPPQLLHPQDQVASLRADQSWSYRTITWPTGERSLRAERPSIQMPRDVRRWDESGWTSARP